MATTNQLWQVRSLSFVARGGTRTGWNSGEG